MELKRLSDDGEDHLNITVVDLPRLNKSLAAAGFEIRPKGGGDGLQSLIESTPQIVAALSPVLQNTQHRQPGPAAPQAPPLIPAPQPGPPPARQDQTESWVVGYIKAQLESRDPESAATWIQAQEHPFAAEMLQLVRTAPNNRVFAVLDEQARQVPEFAPLVDWLKGRGEWTLQVCSHLRDVERVGLVENANRRTF